MEARPKYLTPAMANRAAEKLVDILIDNDPDADAPCFRRYIVNFEDAEPITSAQGGRR